MMLPVNHHRWSETMQQCRRRLQGPAVGSVPLHQRSAVVESLHHDLLSTEQRQMVEDVFTLFELSHDYEFKYESIGSLVTRIREMFSSSDPSIDVNTRSKDGDTLLRLCVSSFHLEEEDPEAQLQLVRFLLAKGADPNLEDSLGETALDWLLDFSTCCEESLTTRQLEMVRTLIEYGGRIYPVDEYGHRYGTRSFNLLHGAPTRRSVAASAARVGTRNRHPGPCGVDACAGNAHLPASATWRMWHIRPCPRIEPRVVLNREIAPVLKS